jgi:hypothetical protein
VLELESEQTAALNELRAGLAAIEALLNTSLAHLPEPGRPPHIEVTEEPAPDTAAEHEEHEHD